MVLNKTKYFEVRRNPNLFYFLTNHPIDKAIISCSANFMTQYVMTLHKIIFSKPKHARHVDVSMKNMFKMGVSNDTIH